MEFAPFLLPGFGGGWGKFMSKGNLLMKTELQETLDRIGKSLSGIEQQLGSIETNLPLKIGMLWDEMSNLRQALKKLMPENNG